MDDYKKPTNFSGGISVGGADLGTARIPQPQWVGVLLTPSALVKSIDLPAGSVLSAVRNVPHDGGSSTGTLDIGPSGSTDDYLDGGDASIANEVRFETIDGTLNTVTAAFVTLATDTTIVFTGISIDGPVMAMVQVQYPMIRD